MEQALSVLLGSVIGDSELLGWEGQGIDDVGVCMRTIRYCDRIINTITYDDDDEEEKGGRWCGRTRWVVEEVRWGESTIRMQLSLANHTEKHESQTHWRQYSLPALCLPACLPACHITYPALP